VNPIEIHAGDDVLTGKVIKEGFLPDLSDWHEEGLGHFELQGDRLLIDAREGGYTAFYKKELPADIVVRYTTRAIEPFQQNNFNLISHCTPPKPGWPIVDMGRYPGYREFDNYIVTFVGDWEKDDWGKVNTKGRVRFRRNPGFHLNREQNPDSRYGEEYEIVYAVNKGNLRYYINGEFIDEWQDPEPLAGGFFALRTFSTVALYRDITLAALTAIAPAS